MKFGYLVLGPAGSGKSTFCNSIRDHCEAIRRRVHIVNLDPAAEYVPYECDYDVRTHITTLDVMEEMGLGPNGALLFATQYMIEHQDFMDEIVEAFVDDDFILFDFPGQIEIQNQTSLMNQIIHRLTDGDFSLATVYCLDVCFMLDAPKLLGGLLAATSCMLSAELPHVTILTKCDIVDDPEDIQRFLDLDPEDLVVETKFFTPRFHKLQCALAQLVGEFNLISCLPMNIDDEDSLGSTLYALDNCLQYGENTEPKADFDMDQDG